MIVVFPVCYYDMHFVNYLRTEREKCSKFEKIYCTCRIVQHIEGTICISYGSVPAALMDILGMSNQNTNVLLFPNMLTKRYYNVYMKLKQ